MMSNLPHQYSLRIAAWLALFMPAAMHAGNISAVWANEGGDKVSQDELRATLHKENLTGKVINRAWDGAKISLFGARNETVSFNLVLEAAYNTAANVSVSFDTLVGPDGATIHSNPATGNDVFSWVGRPIELFYERYLQIKGLSYFGYYKGDERQTPVRFQRPWIANGIGLGLWTDRPDHDKYYPDILIPLELVPTFSISAGQNQSIWGDIYIPKGSPAGTYSGNIVVTENGQTTYTIPVQLTVYNFDLPDKPTVQVAMPAAFDILQRYVTGQGGYVLPSSPGGQRVEAIRNRHFEMFHRHKIALLGDDDCAITDSPCPSAVPRYTGTLFTPANGYDGPGVGVPVGIYAVGLYASWSWKYDGESAMWQHSDNWINWFDQNAPGNSAFLYLADEPRPQDMPLVEQWSEWLAANPGPGNRLLGMSTHNMVLSQRDAPSLAIPASVAEIGMCPGDLSPCDTTGIMQRAADFYSQTPGRGLWMYNDSRTGVGTLDTEDDGVAPRVIPWAQYKKGVQTWFYWQTSPAGTQDLFQNAVTWGTQTYFDALLGWYGSNGPTNGNGVLVYPGTDLSNPLDSYGVDGPFASLRLKEWRRGIQDTDYLSLAAKIDPVAVQTIMNSVVPQVLWENPSPGGDPSWFRGPVSWSSDPDVWEAARAQLAAIISGKQ